MGGRSGARLSRVSCLLAFVGLATPFVLPWLPGWAELPDAFLRMSAFLPALLLLAGLATGIAARRRGEAASARSAIAWNALFLLAYAGMTVMVVLHPPTPS
jgi:hypothetical protein